MKHKQQENISESEQSSDDLTNVKINTSANRSRKYEGSSDTTDNESDSNSSSSNENLSNPTKFQQKSTPITSGANKVKSSPLDKFSSHNAHLKKITINEQLTKNDEVYMLRVPENFNINNLIGKTIDCSSNTKVKVDGKKYMIGPYDDDDEELIITDSSYLVHPILKLQLERIIKHKSVTLQENTAIEGSFKSPPFTEIPDRSHFQKKNKIILSKEIEDKLLVNVDSILKEEKKKKRNNANRDRQTLILENLESHVSTSELEEKSKKKKKKSKNKSREVSESRSPEYELQNKSPVKTVSQTGSEDLPLKKKKGTVINSTIIPNMHLPNFDINVSEILSQSSNEINKLDEPTFKTKKKKKSKLKEEAPFFVDGNESDYLNKEAFTMENENGKISPLKNKKNVSENLSQSVTNISELDGSNFKVKKKNKIKVIKDEAQVSDTNEFEHFNLDRLELGSISDVISHIGNKRNKREITSQSVSDDLTLQAKKKKKKLKEIKQEVYASLSETEPDNLNGKKLALENISDETSLIKKKRGRSVSENLSSEEFEIPQKKKKKREKIIKEEVLSEGNVSDEEFVPPSRDKTKKSKVISAETPYEPEINNEEYRKLAKKVKKEKIDKEEVSEEQNSLILSLLSSVKNEIQVTKHKKKKKMNS